MQPSRSATLLAGLASAWLVGCAGLPQPEWPLGAEPEASLPPLVEHPPADLPAPEGLRATSGEYREIPLQWDLLLNRDVAGYRIERAEQREGPFEDFIVVWGRGVIAIADRGGESTLGDGATRYYRMRAFARDGRLSEAISQVVVGTTAPLPSPPSGLRAYSNQPREVPISWRASDDPLATSYTIERSPAPDGPFERIADLPGRHATSYVDTGLGDLRVLFYRVSTRNPDGASGAPSESVRAVTKPEPLPPLGLHLAAQQLGRNRVVWEPNVEPDIGQYRLYRVGSDGQRSEVVSVPGDVTTAEDAQVLSGETARYVVVAIDRDGLESRPSDLIAVRGVHYTLTGRAERDGIHLEWNPRKEEGFVAARVERLGWLRPERLGNTEGGHFLDDDVDLAPGEVYRYVVVLERADETSAPPSRTLSVRIPSDSDAQ